MIEISYTLNKTNTRLRTVKLTSVLAGTAKTIDRHSIVEVPLYKESI